MFVCIVLVTLIMGPALFAQEQVDLGNGCGLIGAPEVLGETYDCGTFTVPVDYSNPESATIELTYVVLRASGEDPAPDPIVMLAGGPGQSAVVLANASPYGALRETHDLVFPAQRGTLFGQRLSVEECVGFMLSQGKQAEVEALSQAAGNRQPIDVDLPIEDYLAAYSAQVSGLNQACYQAFADAGLDPTQFNTLNSARDIVGLMAYLGYETYNLHGISYGTRLALEILRNFPEENVRSVVLDSVAVPSANRLISHVHEPHDAVMRLFADCANDDACNTAYPNLVERTNALLDQLTSQPIEADGQTVGVREVFTQLADLSGTRANYLPRMIAELESGDLTTYNALSSAAVGSVDPEATTLPARVQQLMTLVVSAGVTEENPFAGIVIVGKIQQAIFDNAGDPDATRKEISAIITESLANAPSYELMQDLAATLTNEDLGSLVSQMRAASAAEENQPAVDETIAALRTTAVSKNGAQYMLNGIVCYEELPFSSLDDALAEYDRLAIPWLGGSRTQLAVEVGNCTNYPMGEPQAFYDQPVSSDVPVLILQGEFDVRTPLQNGITASQELAQATLVIVPEKGHETWVAADNCVGSIAISFLQDPSQTLDTACLASRDEHFVMPDEDLLSG
ncbi:MAG: alpha/beta fold hydrolase [Anaerolineae bacterium]|nr:alpha/beta fold hydrolase [Anaerolineae bacterium]